MVARMAYEQNPALDQHCLTLSWLRGRCVFAESIGLNCVAHKTHSLGGCIYVEQCGPRLRCPRTEGKGQPIRRCVEASLSRKDCLLQTVSSGTVLMASSGLYTALESYRMTAYETA